MFQIPSAYSLMALSELKNPELATQATLFLTHSLVSLKVSSTSSWAFKYDSKSSETKSSTDSAKFPNKKMFSSPISLVISTLAPSTVPMINPPFKVNFMFEVPEASVPAVEMCSDKSEAGQITSALETL
ncbi:hypothetical protein WICPIJ_009374 [Wickerhamomyces pijperi]|uniref:Uncharacterized protein n=1 Tax=Wickerhamomyces pijperi TaxID=599730 RepID=A0A9P8TD13_WICPI|nr:hypothetical protein WICPIJ_009374 [Wickerhamomyces pijperi]